MRSIGLAAVTLQGFIDAIERGVVYGWAWNPQRPEDRLDVDILHGDEVIGTVTADRYRADLIDLEIGDGCHSFEFVLPDSFVGVVDSSEVEVRFSGSIVPLPRMQVRPQRRERPDGPSRSEQEMIDVLRARIAMQEQVIADMSNVMKGLVERLRDIPMGGQQLTRTGEADGLAAELDKQSVILQNLEVYMTTYGQTLRDLADRPAPSDRGPDRPASGFRSIDAVFLAALAAMSVGFLVVFGVFS